MLCVVCCVLCVVCMCVRVYVSIYFFFFIFFLQILNPSHPEALEGKALILFERGNNEKALETWKELLTFDSHDYTAWNNAGFFFFFLYFSPFPSYLLTFLPSYLLTPFPLSPFPLSPFPFPPSLPSGEVLLKLGRLEEAEIHYKKALEIENNDPSVWFNLGVVLGRLGKWEESKEAYDKAVFLPQGYEERWANH